MESRKNDIIDRFELPRDVLCQDSVIRITGNHEMVIDNLKGILSFAEEKAVLQTKQCRLAVEGARLVIDFYTDEEVKLKGKFSKLEFGDADGA